MAFLKTLGPIDFYTNSPNVGCGITSTGVIAGTGSLRVWKGTGGAFVVQAVRNTTPYRFVSGYGYLRWKFATQFPSARIGYYCLAAQADVSGTTGRCYSVYFLRTSGAQFSVNIHEFATGLANNQAAGGASLELTPKYTILGTVYSLSVKWIVDIPRYGGLWVRGWVLQGTTLPDTATPPTLEHTFALSVQPSTFGEGDWYRLQDTTNLDFIADQVGRYALLVP